MSTSACLRFVARTVCDCQGQMSEVMRYFPADPSDRTFTLAVFPPGFCKWRAGRVVRLSAVMPGDTLSPKMDDSAKDHLRSMLDWVVVNKVLTNGVTKERKYQLDDGKKIIFYQGSHKRDKKKAKSHFMCQGGAEDRRQQERIDIREVLDVRRGHASDVFNKYNTHDPAKCLVIKMSKRTQPYNLVMPDEKLREDWYIGLRALIKWHLQLQQLQCEKIMIQDYFVAADRSKDSKLSLNEIWTFIQNMNVDLKKSEVKKKFQEADVNKGPGKPQLDLFEFTSFYQNLATRPDLKEVYTSYGHDSVWTKKVLEKFLREEQKLENAEDSVMKILSDFEPSKEHVEREELTLQGFRLMANSPVMAAFNVDHEKVYHDMDRPLSDYFINSSHNTYLLKGQLRGPSSVEAYINAMMKGCKCVELDCWDGHDGEPVVYHGHTITTKIKFKDILEDAIKDYAFYVSDYPLILSIENHCSVPQQKRMAKYFTDILGDMLYTDGVPEDATHLPSPDELKRKILIKGKRGKHKPNLTQEDSLTAEDMLVSEEEESDEEEDGSGAIEEGMDAADSALHKEQKDKKKKRGKMSVAPEFAALVNWCSSVHFPGFDKSISEGKCYQMSSMAEASAVKRANDQATQFIKHNRKQLTRTYPSGRRINSSNYNPQHMWKTGCQIVALNYQTNDEDMQNYLGKFRDNGACGYVLKPDFLLSGDEFNPNATEGFPNKKLVRINILGGCNLPRPSGRDILDPYVKVVVSGVKTDEHEFKSATIKNNGLNPQWNNTFEFSVNVPELAIIRFGVKDEDTYSSSDYVAQQAFPFTSLKTGYRHVNLLNMDSASLGASKLFMKIEISDCDG